MPVQKHADFDRFQVLDHPIVTHKAALLRDKSTPHYLFRQVVRELSILLAYEASRDLNTRQVTIETPVGSMETEKLAHQSPIIIPILRAGLGMVEGFLDVIPTARVGHIGLFRDETTLEPQHYYFKIPSDHTGPCYIIDPMLATGGSASDAATQLKSAGVNEIHFIGLIAAPDGVRHLQKQHPDIPITVAVLDAGLNDQSYIVPGLGDAGDRINGTFE